MYIFNHLCVDHLGFQHPGFDTYTPGAMGRAAAAAGLAGPGPVAHEPRVALLV